MNAKTRKLATLVAVVLTFCLVSLEQLALAQAPKGYLGPRGNSAQSTSARSVNSNCKKLKGRSVSVFDPATGISSGPITNAGILNGTAEGVINFNAGFVFTPDPNVVTYLDDLTITAIHGQLRSSTVITQNVVTGDGTEWGYINPNTSTGRFAGATGVIFFTFKLVGDDSNGPYVSQITGEICLAHDDDDR